MKGQQTARLRMKLLSPLHIGGSEGDLRPMEFAACQGRVYVVSEERLAERLEEQGILVGFSQAVVQAEGRFQLEAYLRDQGLLSPEFLQPGSLYSSVRRGGSPRPALRPFVRNGLSQPFVPGSAVKGVLRVAILYCLLKRLSPQRRKEVLEDFVRGKIAAFKRDPRNKERAKKELALELDRRVFQHFSLSDDQQGFDPHTDLLRTLKVSDSSPFGKDSLIVEEVKLFSLGSGEKHWSIFAECLPEGARFEVKVTVDLDLLEAFSHQNRTAGDLGLPFEEIRNLLLDPLRASSEMAADVLEYERKGISKEEGMEGTFDFREEPNIRLGWGGGLLSATVDLLLSEGLRKELRDTFFAERTGFPAPKSRKRIKGGPTLGWALADLDWLR